MFSLQTSESARINQAIRGYYMRRKLKERLLKGTTIFDPVARIDWD